MGCHLIVNSLSRSGKHVVAAVQRCLERRVVRRYEPSGYQSWVSVLVLDPLLNSLRMAVVRIMSRLINLQADYENVARLVSGACKDLTPFAQIC
jgi:hypothetical protein